MKSEPTQNTGIDVDAKPTAPTAGRVLAADVVDANIGVGPRHPVDAATTQSGPYGSVRPWACREVLVLDDRHPGAIRWIHGSIVAHRPHGPAGQRRGPFHRIWRISHAIGVYRA